jgi:hypothetical protein
VNEVLPVSSKYKEYVYTTEYARHFIPEVILKIIDLFARQCCSYTASSMIPFSSRAQLIDDVFGYGSGCFGTCEYNQFILDGMHDTFSKQQATEGSVNAQVGFMGEVMSNSACLFDPVLTLTCLYSQTIETVGRAIFFNETEASFPVDFDIAYYNNDNLLKTIQVRGNTDFVYNSVEGVTGYNKIIYTFMKTALPYSRVKIVEDIPGLYIQYTEGDVVSMNYTFSVDLFSLELLTGEIDVTLKNEEKIFNILNSEGIESYLARSQPLEFFVTMVFPDGTKERIRLGTLFITKWQTKSSTLEAQFTARDALDKLYQDDYKKGV